MNDFRPLGDWIYGVRFHHRHGHRHRRDNGPTGMIKYSAVVLGRGIIPNHFNVLGPD